MSPQKQVPATPRTRSDRAADSFTIFIVKSWELPKSETVLLISGASASLDSQIKKLPIPLHVRVSRRSCGEGQTTGWRQKDCLAIGPSSPSTNSCDINFATQIQQCNRRCAVPALHRLHIHSHSALRLTGDAVLLHNGRRTAVFNISLIPSHISVKSRH
jgi:hypothetical protein